MSQTTAWLEALDGTNAVAATFRYSLHGIPREGHAADSARVAFEDADPVRTPPSYPHRKSFEGRLWLASTRQHVLFESFWERAFLANLDRTQSAERVASQPMWIDWSATGRSHAPDFFVRRTDGTALLVDVHTKDDTDADDEAKFELTRRLSGALGWDYLVVDELPGATQQNLRFLLRYREPQWLDGVDIDALPTSGAMSFRAFLGLLTGAVRGPRGAAYALLWHDRAQFDLARPLTMTTAITFDGEQ
ncbi:TnsA-like heteromeric transposase endonuclease subunit [Microbacterium sp. MMO-10]|uniref:TnsA-like heteromeric transposase endonuclease subunit n=1 Tax=Microbacterium sp. MMO-10 TaxID=3081272 RepID=UPI003015896B